MGDFFKALLLNNAVLENWLFTVYIDSLQTAQTLYYTVESVTIS